MNAVDPSEIPESTLPTGRYVTTADGTRMHVHLVGPEDGPVVVWLHGSGPGASGWSNFGPNAARLAEAGFRSVLLDSLGYGRSDKPTDRRYTLDVMAGAAKGALDALGIHRFSLVGNSHGGAVAIRLALDHPSRVENLVLMAPGGLEPRETYLALPGIRSLMRALYGPEGLTLEGMRILFTKQVFDPAKFPAGVIEERFAVARTQPRHVFETMEVPDQSDRLGEIAAPTLVLWGKQDVFCPPSGADKIAARVAGARVVLVEGCGHWVMVEHAELFDRSLLEFLRG